MYKYTAFGLQIASEVAFNELLSGDDSSADVMIEKGLVSDAPRQPTLSDKKSTFETNFSFLAPNVGKFKVSNGNKIIVEPLGASGSSAFKPYLLGTAFGILLLQRGLLPIHGSAFIFNGKSVIITGASGAGKSTLLSAFRKLGYPLHTDDIAPLTIDQNGAIRVLPGYPQQKLWKDSAEYFLEKNADHLVRIEGERDKYFLPANNGFWNEPADLSAIFELIPGDTGSVVSSRLNKHLGLIALMSNTYRIEAVNDLGIGANHFSQCAAVVDHIPVFRMTRPRALFTVDELTDLILQRINDL
ncbi:HPr kinase [Syntrophobotulus glycolicus DSM 8271]|uniref:HPr kinase n=1 Tax=Syntrophobotulus glycolicus (strain DSM 8271 / FlGlyR) TaxID=645991 RepID=F0SY82_SYNGF|nr:HPr kinase [Syntrophobotulus glycolicus]ADY55917.1 HPr kinase [Syntrophobotulus glycolicus DSM 8271]